MNNLELYKFELNRVNGKFNLKTNDLFDFEDSPYAEEFNKSFMFYRETLSLATRYGVKSSYIIYFNSFEKNAKAVVKNNEGIICINSGLKIWLIKEVLKKNELHKLFLNEFGNDILKLDNDVNVLIYQFMMHFTFYHELAHLIQLNSKNHSELNERPKGDKYDPHNHKMEIDADSFSTASLTAHIEKYLLKTFNNDFSEKHLNMLLIIFGASIMIYIRTFSPPNEQLYYKKKSHPHPLIRLLNVIISLIDQFEKNEIVLQKKIKLNTTKLINEILNIVDEIEDKIYNIKSTEKLIKTIAIEREKIVNHYKIITELKPNEYRLAVDVWNNTIQHS